MTSRTLSWFLMLFSSTHPIKSTLERFYSVVDLILSYSADCETNLCSSHSSLLHTAWSDVSSVHFEMLSRNTAASQSVYTRVIESNHHSVPFIHALSLSWQTSAFPLLITPSYCKVLDSEIITVFV